MSLRQLKYFAIAFLALFFFAGIPVEFGNEGSFFHGYMVKKPVISIGIGVNLKQVEIRASSGMKIYEVNSLYKLLADDTSEALVKGSGEKLTEKFLVFVGYAKDRREADRLAADLKSRVSGRVYVEEEEGGGAAGSFAVKLGDFLTRGEALAKVEELRQAGFKEAWIVREDVPEFGANPFWLLNDGKLHSLPTESTLYFIPANPQSFLEAGDRSYRGFFILKSSRRGLTLVNVLNLEDYLKSVVPGEMSPLEFGSVEALKAQAVAARTYALKNMGQFQSSGYDLLHTPRSQVYLGMKAEHPLTTRAVEETSGEVMVYKGELINALYTSTCGGRTEDVENVFSGTPLPYLKSVECAYERQPEYRLRADASLAPSRAAANGMSYEAAFLISLGVIPVGVGAVNFGVECPPAEAAEWVRNAASLLGVKNAGQPSVDETKGLDHNALAGMLVRTFGWEERVGRLVFPSEVEFLTRRLSRTQAGDKNVFAYCLQAGLFPSFAFAEDAYRPVTRGEVAFALARILNAERDFFKKATFISLKKDMVRLDDGIAGREVKLSHRLFLVSDVDGRKYFTDRLTLLGGEKVRWLEREGMLAMLEVLAPAVSDSLDRFSRLNRWQVVRTREELEARLNQYYSLGRLVDMTVKKTGASGRVVELEIQGADGVVSVNGFQVRTVLGLRDTLFVIDRAYDEDGRVARFVFTGRGWGHGVGLCQVGAYGMALAGAPYREILKKYYRGIKFEKLA